MLDLDEQIRILIDDVEPVSLNDLSITRESAKAERHIRGRLGVLALVAALAATIVVVTVPDDQSPNTQNLRWRLAGYTGPMSLSVQGAAGSGTYALQCPTAATCYTTEPVVLSNTVVPNGAVESSTDGGQTWHIVLDEPEADLFGLTCPSEDVCAVTGEDFVHGSLAATMYSTTDGGLSWANHVIPGGSLSSSQLSCTSQNDCVATTTKDGPSGSSVVSTAWVTKDSGTSWAAAPLPGYFRPVGLDCRGTMCVAIGANPPNPTALAVNDGTTAYSTDGGISWHLGSAPAADIINALSCSDAQHCMATEETILAPGSQEPVPVPLRDVVIATDNGGMTWEPVAGNEPEGWLLSGVDCMTALECIISGVSHPSGETLEQIGKSMGSLEAFVRITTDGGKTWSSMPLPLVAGRALGQIGYLSCPSSETCFALANNPAEQTAPEAGMFPQEVVLSTKQYSQTVFGAP